MKRTPDKKLTTPSASRSESVNGGAATVDFQALRAAGLSVPVQFKGLLADEAERVMEVLGEPRYRARQILEWVYHRDAAGFGEMTNLSAELRARLSAVGEILRLVPAGQSISAEDGTMKYLFRLPDGEAVESVLIRYRSWTSVCVSTQVGCRMGCAFCASAIGGLVRQLSPGEILDQVLRLRSLTGRTVDRVVVMGTGEPLDNYANTLKFLRLLHEPYSLGLSYRHITVSTSGLVPEIRRLAGEGLPVTLAISLHAPRDDLRRRLMPVARHFPLKELIAAADEYASATGRRVTYEYTLIDGLNDGRQEALELARLLAGRLAHVNLIPLNPVRERAFRQARAGVINDFLINLRRAGVPVTVRRGLGSDINAACGQLRRSRRSDEVPERVGERRPGNPTSPKVR